MLREFTSCVYIVEQQRVLLIFHLKMQKWLPPGGHLEPNELPCEAAKREAREETGLEIELIPQENVWIDRWNAKSFERPYLCLLENIPARGDHPAHQHIDMIYVAKPAGGTETLNANETDGLRWFSLEEIEAMSPDIEIFEETRQALRKILTEPAFT